MDLFGIEVTYCGDNLLARVGLLQKLSQMIAELGEIITRKNYTWLIVQGDTMTATAGSIAGFLNRVPVAHVEAGLRTWNLDAPWPEEFSRRVITLSATAHFCPTQEAKENLLREGVDPSHATVTGNTVVDALQYVRNLIRFDYVPQSDQVRRIPTDKKLILVTGHRRENFGKPLKDIVGALRKLAADGDKSIVFPVHLNPDVKRAVYTELSGTANIYLIDPVCYPDFVYLMERAWTIVTDSGGIQEEAPTFHRPIVVTRVSTERPEAVNAGFVTLVGSDAGRLVRRVRELTSGTSPVMIKGDNPFGKGDAAKRIASSLRSWNDTIGVRIRNNRRSGSATSLQTGYQGSISPAE
jgi:UDP-N-acetylglucosamine 2-epimerase